MVTKVLFDNEGADVYINYRQVSPEHIIILKYADGDYYKLFKEDFNKFYWVDLGSGDIYLDVMDSLQEALKEVAEDGSIYVFRDLLSYGQWLVEELS